MIRLIRFCSNLIVFIIICSSVSASDFTAADLKIDNIKQALELQLERIRNATEKADAQMSLARMRIAERLRLSSEELARQLDLLERIRDQLSDGTGGSQQAIDQFKNDWTQLLQTANAQINSQLNQTNDLINQMDALRDSFEDTPAPGLYSQNTLGINTSGSGSNPLTTAGSTPSLPTPILPTPPTMPATGSG